MDKLKPCPFCGGEVRVIIETKVITCDNCKIVFFHKRTDLKGLIKAWNRRAE